MVRVKGNFLILTGCLLLATEMTREGLRRDCICKNIHVHIGPFPCFRARICTAVRTGAKMGTHFVSILCT